jgi:site-specific recombinase XerD
MILENYTNGFKRYALYEREINHNTTKDIINAVIKLDNYVNPKSLKELNTRVIRDYLYIQKEQKCWAARTFRNQRQYLKVFFNYCVSHEYLNKNPIDKIERPKLPKTLPRFLTSEQIKTILIELEQMKWRYELEKYRNKTIIYILLYTGIRLNELVHLKITDVNLVENELFIRKGKGRKERMIPIHYKLKPILQQYLEYIKHNDYRDTWLFYNLRNNFQIKKRTVQTLCEKLSKRVGFKFSSHWLRHSFARLCVNSEIGLYKIKEMMGHSNISTTEIYLSVSKRSLKEGFCKKVLLD